MDMTHFAHSREFLERHTLILIRQSVRETHPHILGLSLVRAEPADADLLLPAVGAVRPGEMPRLTHQMTIGLSCAPQATTRRLHEGTGFRAFAERKFALTV